MRITPATDGARNLSGSSGTTISEMTDGEECAVVALWQQCGLTRPWNDPVDDLRLARATSTSGVLVARLDPADAASAPTAAEREPGGLDGLLGTVMVGLDGHRGWLYYLAVSPEAQGRGIGRRLVVAAEAWLVAQGAPKVQLMVRSSNAGVVAFYERLGYADQDCVVLGRRLG